MKPTDIVNVVAYDPLFNDNLVLEQRDGKRVTLEDYINQKIIEQLENGTDKKITAEKFVETYALVRYRGQDYKVYREHAIEKWVEDVDDIAGSWRWVSSLEAGYEEISKAGLEALKQQ